MDDGSSALVERLRRRYPELEVGFEFGVGVNTGSMRADMTSDVKIDDRYHPMISGSGIERYGRVRSTGWIVYDPAMIRAAGTRGRSLPPQRFFDEPKILVVRTRNLALKRRLIATIEESGAYNLNRLTNIIARDGYSLDGLLGILNSSLFNWIFAGTFYDYEIKPTYLRSCPMADTNDSTLVDHVRTMRAAVGRRELARTVAEQQSEERLIAATDAEIDRVVAALYGLSAVERQTVEQWDKVTRDSEQIARGHSRGRRTV